MDAPSKNYCPSCGSFAELSDWLCHSCWETWLARAVTRQTWNPTGASIVAPRASLSSLVARLRGRVGPWIYHWLYQDLWSPVWPNLVASLVVYAFVYLKVRSLTKLHEEQLRLHQQLVTLHNQHHHEQMEALKKEPGSN